MTVAEEWRASDDVERSFSVYRECDVCGGGFAESDDVVIINWLLRDGGVGQQPMHRACAEKHPMNISNALA